MTDYTAHIVSPHSPTAANPKPKRRYWVLLAGALVALAAITFAAVTYFLPRSFDVTGTFVLVGEDHFDSGAGCRGNGGYRDIGPGVSVVVTGKAGNTIAIGELGSGEVLGGTCTFPFTVADVPAGEDFYGIEVSHRGRLQYTEAKMREPLALTLG